MKTLPELIVSGNFAVVVVSLVVALTWGIAGIRTWRRPGAGLLLLIAVGWFVGSIDAAFWGTSRHGRVYGDGGTQWMTDSLPALGLLLAAIAVGMAHIIKATWSRYGWWPATACALGAGAAWTWPEHVVGALRALTGI